MRNHVNDGGETAQFVRIGKAGKFTGYQCGSTVFVTGQIQMPETLTVPETWECTAGTYLFLGQTFSGAEAAEFLKAAARFCAACDRTILFGWIHNPADDFVQWEYELLLQEGENGGVRAFKSGREFAWQQYALFLPGGSRMVLKDEAVFVQQEGAAHRFFAPQVVLDGIGNAKIPLVGNDAGIWQMDFMLPPQTDIFERLDAGIRYWAKRKGQPYCVTAPLFHPDTEIKLLGRFDFTKNPEDGMRFFFDKSAAAAMCCDIPTIYGRQMRAKPFFLDSGELGEDCPQLVMAKGIRWFVKQETGLLAACGYYLTYGGRFDLQIVTEDGDFAEDDRILCGRMGTEYIRCSAGGSLPIKFLPGHAAYCKMDGEEGLETIATTAWAAFGADEAAAKYYSAASQTALYAQKEQTSDLLTYFELPSAQLLGECAVPFLPVQRLIEKTPDKNLPSRMEAECILPVRSERILAEENMCCSAKDGEVAAATPQGLLVGVAGEKWNWIGIASNQDAALPDSKLEGISDRLLMEFHDSRLFLPMADAKAMAEQIQQWSFALTVEDWQFLVDKAHFRSDREDKSDTAVIFKYAKDKSLDELMEEASFHNPKLAGDVKQIYRRAAACAYDRDGNVRSDYRNFNDIIHDREFCGVLLLNCPLTANAMPPELKLLLAGLAPDALYAHHMGIHANDIVVCDGSLRMRRSSYFGIVDYNNEQVIVNEDAAGRDYDFITKRILLEIRNSAIVQFAAEAELLVNRLFDAKAAAITDEAGNCLVLEGSYQNCGGIGQYVFALQKSTVFILAGSMLSEVEVSEVRMKAADADGRLTGEFSISGKLRFLENESCDVWAYGLRRNMTGDGEKEEDGYLKFDGLSVDMSIAQAGPGAKRFTVAYDALQIDESSSVRRSGSLPACLPSHPGALTRHECSGGMPSALGYRSITCPVEQGEIKTAWYGLHYTIPLGTLGANASTGALELKLLCAWGVPDNAEETMPVFVGIGIPGMGADGIRLNLQGILKLDFKSVELHVYRTKEKTDYQLCFRNFTLSALGLSFPPGKNNIYLFGEDGSKLGWYAAYQEEKEDGDGKGDDACGRSGCKQLN